MKFANRLKFTTAAATNAAVLTFSAKIAGYRSLAEAIAAGDLVVGDKEVPIVIEDSTGNWENSYYTVTNGTILTRESISASSNNGQAVVFSGALTAGCQVFAEYLRRLPGVYDIPFAQAVPLSRVGSSYMPATNVGGALAFTPAVNAVRGALVYLRLTADGANLPTFTGFKEWGGSSGYDNRSGIVNVVQFFYDGVDVWYSVAQAVGAVAVVNKPGAPSLGAAVPGDGYASFPYSPPSSNGGSAITGYSLSVYKTSDNSLIGTVATTLDNPIVAGGLTNGVAVYGKLSAINSAGTGPQSAASNTVTPAVAAVTYTRLNSLKNVTESGTGPYSYTGTSTGNAFAGDGGVSSKLAAGIDGSITATINNLNSGNSFILGVSNTPSKVSYPSTFIALYPDVNSGNAYTTITDGNAAGRVATGTAGQAGDKMRIRRVGSTYYAEIARASDPKNFIQIRSFTGYGSGDVYFQVDIGGSSATAQVDGVNI